MITYKNIYKKVYEFKNLNKSFYFAARSKHDRLAVADFVQNLEENIIYTSENLKNHTYSFGPYRSFYIFEPKKRLIESACFRDRVVHHSIFNVLEPIFEAQFYHHSYACRFGRGHHKAMTQLHHWMQTGHYSHFLKCDIKKFFPSVNRNILIEILNKTIKDFDLIKCLENLIFQAPRSGIPIGNLTSQLFANIYLNELDQFIKRSLRAKKYIRYMDDFIILTSKFSDCKEMKNKIKFFLSEKLKLDLSPQKVFIGSCEGSLSFLGFHLKKEKITLRSPSYKRMKKKIRSHQMKELEKSSSGSRLIFRSASGLISCIDSYMGHIGYCTPKERKKLEIELTMAKMLNGKEICKNTG